MEIKKLKLVNFRNYDNLEIDFNKKNTIFIGNNAQGKTNILESIYVLGLTKSFLNVNEKNLIKFDKEFAKIQGTILNNNIESKLEILINEKGKKVKINNHEVKKLSNYISRLNVIIFSPDNIRLLKESPAFRRRYLNIEISQLYGDYIRLLNDFNTILKQRNEYLKVISLKNECDNNYLDILDSKYAQLSVDIYNYRKRFFDKINENLSIYYKNITGYDGLNVKYISNIDYNEDNKIMYENFYKKLKDNYNRDLYYKISMLGPHRDDFKIELDGKDILLYGSQGQVRCSIITFKFAEIPIFNSILDISPILLLDDIFSELDVEKKKKLISFLPDYIQTIITTTDLNMINTSLFKDLDVYIVNSGNVKLREGND